MKKILKKIVVDLLLCVMSLSVFSACDSFGKLGFNVGYENYYEAHIEFYVNPEKPKEVVNGSGSQYGVYGAYSRHVMDNIVKLLSSESFTEILIDGRDGEEEIPYTAPMNGLPQKYDYLDGGEAQMTEEYKTFLSRVRNAVFFSYAGGRCGYGRSKQSCS